jgi:hypothetical protein
LRQFLLWTLDVVWTLVCSGRSGYSGHPWGVQILDAWGTLDGTSGLDGRVTLDACAVFNTSGRQESGRLVIVWITKFQCGLATGSREVKSIIFNFDGQTLILRKVIIKVVPKLGWYEEQK